MKIEVTEKQIDLVRAFIAGHPECQIQEIIADTGITQNRVRECIKRIGNGEGILNPGLWAQGRFKLIRSEGSIPPPPAQKPPVTAEEPSPVSKRIGQDLKSLNNNGPESLKKLIAYVRRLNPAYVSLLEENDRLRTELMEANLRISRLKEENDRIFKLMEEEKNLLCNEIDLEGLIVHKSIITESV